MPTEPPLPSDPDNELSSSVHDAEINLPVQQESAASNGPPSDTPAQVPAVPLGPTVSPHGTPPLHQVRFSETKSPPKSPPRTQFHSSHQGRRSAKYQGPVRTNDSRGEASKYPPYRDPPPHQVGTSGVLRHYGNLDATANLNNSGRRKSSTNFTRQSRQDRLPTTSLAPTMEPTLTTKGSTVMAPSHEVMAGGYAASRPNAPSRGRKGGSDRGLEWGLAPGAVSVGWSDLQLTDLAWGSTPGSAGWVDQPSAGGGQGSPVGWPVSDGSSDWGGDTSTAWGDQVPIDAKWTAAPESSGNTPRGRGHQRLTGAGRDAPKRSKGLMVDSVTHFSTTTPPATDTPPLAASSVPHATVTPTAAAPSVHPAPSTSTVRAQLDSLLSSFIPAAPPPLPSIPFNWRGNYIDRGVLIVKPHDEVRLRYRALLNPSWSLYDIITDAIHRGIHFFIAVKREDLRLFDLPLQQIPSRPECYTPGFRDRLFVYKDAVQFYHDWEQEVRAILQRPHAYIYLLYGGLLWRIAREFGPSHIWQAVADGPSVAATAWGQYDEIRGPLLIAEGASKHELPVLLGHVDGSTKSLWPPVNYFEALNCWSGEWDDNAEYWFMQRLSQIKAGGQPRLESEWRRDRRFNRRDAVDHKSSFDRAFTILSQTSRGSWNDKVIGNILLPERI